MENTIKENLHPRNKHRFGYDFEELIKEYPELKTFITETPNGTDSIDFGNSDAVRALNTALLKRHYGIGYWEIPMGYLIPPVPGRVDYVHYVAELLKEDNNRKLVKGRRVTLLDIGCGASCIYPIVANTEYGWTVYASEIDKEAFKSAQRIIDRNDLNKKITLFLQKKPEWIFKGLIDKARPVDITMCNPPFYKSAKEAEKANNRRIRNLKKGSSASPVFQGQANELWFPGGELAFVKKMINESVSFQRDVLWFSVLISRGEHIPILEDALEKSGAEESKVLEMSQGNKISRILCWTFFTKKQRKAWAGMRWR